jgi:predicted nucleic acid-binding protein
VSTHLIDANVLIDFLDPDAADHAVSLRLVSRLISDDAAAINQVIYAEVLAGLDAEEGFAAVFGDDLTRLDLPWQAAWPAAVAHRQYRQRGGKKRSPMPDFYIGAHAAVQGLTLVTRDVARYGTYFPKVALVTP